MSAWNYGRQWISPKATYAFTDRLISADELCMNGNLQAALTAYRSEAVTNPIATRRLQIAKRQILQARDSSDDYQSNVIKIGFIDWYPGFQGHMRSILDLFRTDAYTAVPCNPHQADILVAGCYGASLIQNQEIANDKLVVFVSGENISPTYDIHDFSITTRPNSYCGKNIRQPQWLGELIISPESIALKEALEERNRTKRDILVSAIYNNSTPEREEMVAELRKHFGAERVQVFGSQRSGHCNKLEILSRSIINMCFENSIGEGYITEKLLHARIMGCKALYWGHGSYRMDFKDEDILNVHDCKSFQSVINWCSSQVSSPSPILRRTSDINWDIFASRPSDLHIKKWLAKRIKIALAWRSTSYYLGN